MVIAARGTELLEKVSAEIRAAGAPRLEEILSAEALTFLSELHRRFNPKRRELLAARATRQKRFDADAVSFKAVA